MTYTAIQFGAGNIGRGLIAPLLYKDYKIIFTDTNQNIIDAINKEHSYKIKILGEKGVAETIIDNISAILVSNATLLAEITKATLITTAVGPSILEHIAPTIAKGLKLKYQNNNTTYLSIVACENMIGASGFLKEKIIALLNPEEITFINKHVEFANCVVDRIVPPASNKDSLLTLDVEEFYEWIIESTNPFKTFSDNLKMGFTSDLSKYIERKIFTLNTGHATTAYLGYKAGKTTIQEAIADKNIENMVYHTMLESSEALIRKHNLNKEKQFEYVDTIIKRFKNPYIVDKIIRVAKDPKRKLGFNDRFISPLRATIEYNLKNDYLIIAIAHALFFALNNKEDKEALLIQQMENKGLMATIKEITQIKDDIIITKIINSLESL